MSETLPDQKQPDADRTPEFVELMLKHNACHLKQQFELSYRFVKEEREIGQGGQGVVYSIRCEDAFVGSRALKILSPEPYGNTKAYFDEMRRMRDVAATVHQIYHDNLIGVERFEQHDGIYVMVMRLIDGFDLQKLLQDEVMQRLKRSVDEQRWSEVDGIVFTACGDGRYSVAPGVAVNIIEKCLRGVQTLHDKGIVHCDIKPSNIMLDWHGSIRLIDIGSAFRRDAPPKLASWTPRYAPPEVLECCNWTPQGDLASLGYVLVDLLSGQANVLGPWARSESVHTLDEQTRADLLQAKRILPQRLKEILPGKVQQSEKLMRLCQRLVQPDPSDRFKSAEEAFDWTVRFKDELVCAHLAMPWVKVIKQWVTDVKRAMSGSR